VEYLYNEMDICCVGGPEKAGFDVMVLLVHGPEV